MQTLDRNLACLHRSDPGLARRVATATSDPEVQVLEARTGAPVWRVAGALECSAEDPGAEARELARHFLTRAADSGARRLVIFGLAPHVLPQLLAFDGTLLVVEPSLALVRSILERVDLSAALARVSLVVDEAPAPALRHAVFTSGERGLMLAHAPARRRAPALHDHLVSRFHPGGTPRALDIAVIPPMYGGSLPVAHASARALRELGHRVRLVDLEPFWPGYQQVLVHTADARLRARGDRLRADLVRVIGATITSTFELRPPDLVFALAQAPLDAEALETLRAMGIPRALWFCEDFRVMKYWSAVAPLYDTVFHVQPGELETGLREAGGFGHPLPMAFDPSVHRPLTPAPDDLERYGCPVGFVGAGYHNRIQLLPALVPLGLRIWGTDWPLVPPFIDCMPEPNVRQTPEASNRIFNATGINLNLHSSPWVDGINPVGDYLNPRTFELAGAGAFQLVDERSTLRDAFTPGEELETYADVEECRQKIRYFGDRPDERREIAARGRERALAEHTYLHRMREAIRVLEAGPAAVFPRGDAQGSVGAVVAASGDEPELRELLERIEPELPMDASALSAAVGSGSGPLSRTEKLLLYMREAGREVVVHEDGGGAA